MTEEKMGQVTVMVKTGSVSSQKERERLSSEQKLACLPPLLWRFPCMTAQRQGNVTAPDRGFASLILRLTPNSDQKFMLYTHKNMPTNKGLYLYGEGISCW